MSGQRAGADTEFGGPWTSEKLQILERYLDAYTTALKNKPFKLWYIDAFAGSGRITLPGDDENMLGGDVAVRCFLEGSAARAIEIRDKPFDTLVFVEKDKSRYHELRNIRESCLDEDVVRNIVIKNADANEYLRGLDSDWRRRRGVLFLDPYATEVEWATIEKIAGFNALDTWILFPTGALSRMLPRWKAPDDVDPMWAERLTRIFGDESWRRVYREDKNLFEEDLIQRQPGVDGFLSIYKENLRKLFGCRLLKESRTLKNTKNSPLFEFIFCAGHTNGITAAHKIARHLIENL